MHNQGEDEAYTSNIFFFYYIFASISIAYSIFMILII